MMTDYLKPGNSMADSDYETYLNKALAKYKNKEATMREILQVFTSYSDLKPNFQPHIFNDGSRKDLLTLEGTIPVQYKGTTYNIPICMYLMETHPFNGPICYVRPTVTMQINTGKHVDSSGRIYLPYLHEWKHPKSDLIGLIEVMRVVFGEEPPVVAKSASSRQTAARLYSSYPSPLYTPSHMTTMHTKSAASDNESPAHRPVPYPLGNPSQHTMYPGMTTYPKDKYASMAASPNLELQTVEGWLVLDLSNNGLTSIPPEVFHITDLQHLNVSNNRLTSIPEEISHLQKLYTLDAAKNMLTSLPQAVCSLSDLEVLQVSNNKISTLPPGIEKMKKLKALDIGNNLLTELPTALCSLPALQMLIINNNQISRLPNTLYRAQKLESFNATGNPLTYPPRNIFEKGLKGLTTFLKEEAEKEKKMLQAFNRLSLKVRQAELKPIARSLGLDRKEISLIKTSADDLPDQVYLTLEKWKEKEGEDATLPELEECLRDLDYQHLADHLMGTPTSPESTTFESEERGAFGGQEVIQRQKRYPSVTVDDKFPVIKFEQLDFPADCYLGHGGFAAVAKAHHRDWKHDVAVKRLLAREIEGSEQQILYSEARKLNLGSRSASIIGLLGVCLDPHFAIVMPYMENGSLARLLQDVDVPWALRWRMAHEISLGMTFLHCQNPQILHCDLKAENVLLDEDFHVKISDFGLWKWTDVRVGSETSPAGATRTHAPPEYFTDVNRPPTDKFDVYSFGVLLWEIVKRNPPFPYAARGSPAVPTDQRADPAGSDPADLETVNQLIQSCCSHNLDDRPDFKECGDRLSDVTGRYELVHFLKAVIYLQKEKARRK